MKQTVLPNNPEIITIKMPRLNGVFIILENNFKKIMEGCWHNRGSYEWRTTRGKRLDGIYTEDSRDVEIISKFQRGVRINVGDPVNSITLVSIY